MRFSIVTIFIVMIISANSYSEEKLSKPTLFTSPPSYLEKVPLNTLKAEDVINVLGMPDKSNEMFGRTYLSYVLGEGYGKREFTYEITNGVLTDVSYHDQGKYNGMKASDVQKIKDTKLTGAE